MSENGSHRYYPSFVVDLVKYMTNFLESAKLTYFVLSYIRKMSSKRAKKSASISNNTSNNDSREDTRTELEAVAVPITDGIEIERTAEEISNSILESEIVPQTRDQYQRNLRYIQKICEELHPASCENGELLFPIPMPVIKLFFGEMSRPRPDGSVKATSTITGYATALKHAYKDRNIPISEELKKFFAQYHQGYKRTVCLTDA